jgi:HAMP domain-containing protein
MSTLEAKLATLPPEERARRHDLLDAFAELVIEKPLAELERARDELANFPADTAGSIGEMEQTHRDLTQARARNMARVFEDRARLIAECLPASFVQRGLGVSRQRLHQLVKAGRLVAVLSQNRRSSLYPVWQFTDTGTLLPGLATVIDAAREMEMDPETLHFFMVEPNERLGGRTPSDLLAGGKGDCIAAVLRSAGLGPF